MAKFKKSVAEVVSDLNEYTNSIDVEQFLMNIIEPKNQDVTFTIDYGNKGKQNNTINDTKLKYFKPFVQEISAHDDLLIAA